MGILRLLLALSVVIAHSDAIFGTKLVGGKIAVQAFYIISGFYMSMILNEKYIGKNSSFKLFITNRFIRLFPIYWSVLLGTVLICIVVTIFSHGQNSPKFDSYLSVKTNILSFTYLILTNLFIFGQDIVMFLGINPNDGSLFFTSNFEKTNPPLHSFLFIPQAWTLGLELTFYLIAPFILKRGIKLVVILICLSFILRMYLYNVLDYRNDPWSYRFFPTEVMFFLLGYIAYRIYKIIKTKSIPVYLEILTFCLVLIFTVIYRFLPHISFNYIPFSLNEIVYFSMIVLSIPLLFKFLKNNKLDNHIGELSYPVYIAHMMVIVVCNSIPIGYFKTGWLISLITILVAYLLNKIIASPIEKYRQSRLKL